MFKLYDLVTQKQYDMDGDLVIGREKSDISLKPGLLKKCVSAEHMKFVYNREGDFYNVVDLDSTHGTLVNGEDIGNKGRSKVLDNGDEIAAGGYLFLFLDSKKGGLRLVLNELKNGK